MKCNVILFVIFLQPDPIAPSEKYLDLFYDFDKHLKDEDHVISCVRDTETEIAEYLKKRKEECINLQFTISLFDPNRSKIQAAAELRPVPLFNYFYLYSQLYKERYNSKYCGFYFFVMLFNFSVNFFFS